MPAVANMFDINFLPDYVNSRQCGSHATRKPPLGGLVNTQVCILDAHSEFLQRRYNSLRRKSQRKSEELKNLLRHHERIRPYRLRYRTNVRLPLKFVTWVTEPNGILVVSTNFSQ